MRGLLIFLLYASTACFSAAQTDSAAIRNYYIGISFDGQLAELGVFEGRMLSKRPFIELPMESLTKSTIDRYFHLSGDGCELLVYLHCWLGNQSHFHRTTVDGINHTLNIGKFPAVRKTISILWHSSLTGYQENWELAYEKGKRLYHAMNAIDQLEREPVNVLCHSMGNRVFEGMLSVMSDSTKYLRLGEVVLAAADVDADAFDRTLSVLPRQSTRVHILRHRRDRMLWASQVLHDRRRLGLDGPDHADRLLASFQNVFIVDATNAGWRLTSDPSNHVYFYWSRGVRKHLEMIYSHEPMPVEPKKRSIGL